MAVRSRGDWWARASRDWEPTSQRCALDRGRLDRRSLLVHRFDFVCEPGRFPLPARSAIRSPVSPDRRAGSCARAICRCASRIGAKPAAVRQLGETG